MFCQKITVVVYCQMVSTDTIRTLAWHDSETNCHLKTKFRTDAHCYKTLCLNINWKLEKGPLNSYIISYPSLINFNCYNRYNRFFSLIFILFDVIFFRYQWFPNSLKPWRVLPTITYITVEERNKKALFLGYLLDLVPT